MATAVFTNMGASPGDPLHDLICKAAYQAQVLAESTGGPLATAIYPNMAPSPGDSLQTLAAKLVYWLQAAAGGGTGGGLQVAAGNPVNGVTPTTPPYYWNSTASTFWIYANGGWNAH